MGLFLTHSIDLLPFFTNLNRLLSISHQLCAVGVGLFIKLDFYLVEQFGHSLFVWFIFYYCIWLFIIELI